MTDIRFNTPLCSGTETLKPVYYKGEMIGHIASSESKITKYFIVDFSEERKPCECRGCQMGV